MSRPISSGRIMIRSYKILVCGAIPDIDILNPKYTNNGAPLSLYSIYQYNYPTWAFYITYLSYSSLYQVRCYKTSDSL